MQYEETPKKTNSALNNYHLECRFDCLGGVCYSGRAVKLRPISTLVRLVDDDCTAALLVKAHARAGRPHGGEDRRHGR